MKTFEVELIFVYNAGSGIFDLMSDFAQKIFSPATYACSLCMLTYGHLGMKKEWRTFLDNLPIKKTFLHKDELRNLNMELPGKVPGIFLKDEVKNITKLISAPELNSLHSLNDLILLLQKRLEK